MKPFATLAIRRNSLALLLAIAAYVCLSLVVTNSYYQLILTLVPVWATLSVSWNIFSGYSGLTSFGQAAFFGVGAYTAALLQVRYGVTPWIGIPFAGVVGAVAAFIIGIPTLRLRSHYFALAMLTFPLMLMYIAQYLGLQELPMVRHAEAPVAWMQFDDPKVFTILAVLMLAFATLVSMLVEQSRFGLALTAIRENELAAEAAGINPWRTKMLALSLSAAIAAIAGGFYSVVLLVVTPEAVFSVMISAQALILTLFGGIANIWGPLIGAVILIPLSETLHAELGDIIPGIQGVVYGLAIIIVTLIAPEGLFWKVRDLLFARSGKDGTHPPLPSIEAAPPPAAKQPESGQIILQVRDVNKSFGGLKAVQAASFDVAAQEILGIIGPNGAGKTTLFNVLNGVLRANTGTAMFDGKNLLSLKLYEVCRSGVGRTFQVVRSFPRLSVLENVLSGAFGREMPAAEATACAVEALERVGLAHVSDRQADRLTQKELRLMELARALAPKPKLLLLDEPLAGLGREEAADFIAVLRRLTSLGITIVIIEHTMHELLKLVDRLIVLDHGAIIAEGKPREVVENPQVIEAYLGKKWLKK